MTALVALPDCVVLQHGKRFAQVCPHDMRLLRDIIAEYRRKIHGKQLLFAS